MNWIWKLLAALLLSGLLPGVSGVRGQEELPRTDFDVPDFQAFSRLDLANPMALQSGARSTSEGTWEFQLTPYLWIPVRIDGEVRVKGAKSTIDMDMDDFFSLLDFGVSGRFEAWRGDFGFIFDGMYVGLEDNTNRPSAGPDVDFKIQQVVLDFLGAYRLPSLFLNLGSQKTEFLIDVIGGLRYQNLDLEIDLDPGLDLQGDADWVEAVLGGRITWPMREKLSLILRGEVSGFGLGSASDLTWSIQGGTDWRFSRIASLKLAYKFYGIDYSKGSGANKLSLDLFAHGPVVGVTFYF